MRHRALDDRDRAGLAAGVMPSIPGADRVGEKAQHRAQMIGVESEGVAQRIRQCQDPLSDGHLFRQDMIHQIRRALVHAPSHATGAETPAFATERHQVAFVTGRLKQASQCIWAKPCERMPQVRNCCNSCVTCLGRQLPLSESDHIRSKPGKCRWKTW